MPTYLKKLRLRPKLTPKIPKLPKRGLQSIHFSKYHLLVFIIVFAGLGGYLLLHSFAATTGSAANVFVSPNGSDTGTNCIRFSTAQANPDPTGTSLCASFDEAYQLASPGDTVEVEGGTYHPQVLSYTSAKPAGGHCDWVSNDDIYSPVSDFSSCITFTPAPSATVTLSGLTIEAPYFRLNGGPGKNFRFDRTNPLAARSFYYCQISSTLTPLTKSLNGNITTGSPVIYNLPSTSGLVVGHEVAVTSGDGKQLPPGTKLVSIDSDSQITVSNAATITGSSGVTLRFDTGQLVLSGNTTSGSPVVTGLSDTSGLAENLVVSGTGIPAGTIIQSIDSFSQITLSQAATSTGTAGLTFNTGCYYGSAGIVTEPGPPTTAINCYGDSTNGYPQMQSHDIVIQNIWSNDVFGLRGSHVSINHSVFDLGDSWRPDSAVSHINACRKTGYPAIPSEYLQLDGITVKNLIMKHKPNQTDAQSWQLQHLEGIHFEGGQHVVIENSAFQNLAQYDIFLETEDGTPSKDILFQNNVFDPVCSHQPNKLNGDGECAIASGGLQIDCHASDTSLADVTARFNTFLWEPGQYGNSIGWRDESPCPFTGTKVDYGNLSIAGAPSAWECNNWATTVGVVPDHDIWSSGTCGTNALTGDAKVADASNYDAHLAAGSVAIDAVPTGGTGPMTCPATDFEGDSRPQGTSCDAGADEYSSSYVPPAILGDLNSDGHVNVLDLSMLLSHWQSTDTTADINASGKVDILDLSILLSHYGT